jgi:hypothetical protein
MEGKIILVGKSQMKRPGNLGVYRRRILTFILDKLDCEIMNLIKLDKYRARMRIVL